MVRGDDCPLCAELASDEVANAYGYTVADLTRSRLRLAANQWVPGYCILISHVHVREPFELDATDRHAYFDDLMVVGRAIERVYTPIKLNFQLLGHAVPHLHCHITPALLRRSSAAPAARPQPWPTLPGCRADRRAHRCSQSRPRDGRRLSCSRSLVDTCLTIWP